MSADVTTSGSVEESRTLRTAAATLTLQGVRKSFGSAVAVGGVNLDLRAGEFLTMLGPSGSGKTTTLNMIAGFLDPDEGTIELSGRDITHTPSHKRDIGMVFQNYALFPHLSALKNVMFPLEMRGVRSKEARSRAAAALEMVELGAMSSRLPRQLSGGQQQRVALARAFVFEPGLLLMDEPLGALDKRLRETMQVEIMRICREVGSTVVYVTHDQDEALTMSDRIAIFNNGAIEQLDTARNLYERPATVFVADFVGDSSILPCRVDAGGQAVGSGWRHHGTEAVPAGPASLVLRPESVTVALRTERGTSSNGPVSGTQCSVEGDVADVFYLGSHVKYLVETAAGDMVQCRAPRHEVDDRIVRGSSVRASWRPEAGRLLPS